MTHAALSDGRNVIGDLRRSDSRRMAGRANGGVNSGVIEDDTGKAAEVTDVMTT